MIEHWGTAGLLALSVSVFGWRKGWLTAGGAWAALAVGTCVYGVGGWQSSLPILLFFFSANLIPKLFRRQSKSEKRTAMQVFANGGAGAVCCLLTVFYPVDDLLLWGAYLAAIAEAAGDTWATEFGTRFGGIPRLVTNFKPVPVGTSGAVSTAGILATVIGAALIALTGLWSLNLPYSSLPWVIIAGTGACFIDSLLGATAQARYECSICEKGVESPWHCGSPARYLSGWKWLDNSMVNLVCTFAAAGAFLILS